MNSEIMTSTQQDWVEVSDQEKLPKNPLVSVQMIAYNHEPYLVEAIEGVLAQETEFPIELIIGEDCSTDKTRAVALDYQQRYPHIIRVIYSDKNVGMQRNFQRVFEASKGEYIAFCESDDYWIDRNKLKYQVDVLDKHRSVDLTFHSTYKRNFDLKDLFGPYCVARNFDSIIPVEDVISGDGDFIPSASILVRKTAIKKIPQEMLKSAPVIDYILQVYGAVRGGAFYINTPMSVYRRGHPESWSVLTSKLDKLIVYEDTFLTLLDEMDCNLRLYRSSFTELVYRHYFPRLVSSSVNGNIRLKAMFEKILFQRIGEFSFARRIAIRLSTIKVFAFFISKKSGFIRRVDKLKNYLRIKYSPLD